MRLYAFQNMYLSGVQAGIQTQHSTVQLFVKYQPNMEPDPRTELLYEWATNHETTIILNGGDHENLACIYEVLADLDTLPFAAFREEGVNNSLTNVCVVVPEDMYTEAKNLRERKIDFDTLSMNFNEKEIKLIVLLTESRLMN